MRPTFKMLFEHFKQALNGDMGALHREMATFRKQQKALLNTLSTSAGSTSTTTTTTNSRPLTTSASSATSNYLQEDTDAPATLPSHYTIEDVCMVRAQA